MTARPRLRVLGEGARGAAVLARAHPRHIVLFSLVAGLLCGGWQPEMTAAAALAAVALAGRPQIALGAVAAVAVGATVAEARREAIDRGRVPAAVGATVMVPAEVLEPPRLRASGITVVPARLRAGPAAGERTLLRLRTDGGTRLRTGDVVQLRGVVASLAPHDEYQRRRGAIAALDVDAVRVVGRRGGVLGMLDTFRRRGEAALAIGVPAADGAVLAGMVLGQDDAITTRRREAFQASGLAHLLAVSGTNVMLLATLVLAAGAAGGLPLRARLGAAAACVVLYVPLTGAGPSIMRAGVMGVAGLIAALAGRPASRWYAVGLAATVTLAANPYAAADPGWQLSFAAVLGLLAAATPLREALERRRMPRALAEAAAMTVAASVATAPLMAAHFDRVSLVSLVANLAAAPAVAPVMWLGTLAVVTGQLSTAAAWPMTAAAGVLAGYVAIVAEAAAALPGATVSTGLRGAAGALVGYAALAAAVVSGWALHRRGWLRKRPPAGAVAVAAVAAAAVVIGWPAADRTPRLRDGETLIAFLDVGQGDATLIRRGAAAVLVDTGPPGSDVVDRVRRAGVRRLDALVLTHAQADHEGEAPEVVAALQPRLVVNGGSGWPTAVQRQLTRAVAAAGGRLVETHAGDRLAFAGASMRVLWPPEAVAEAPPRGDPNDRALVTHVRVGSFDVLLMADAETNVTSRLRLPEAEVLKVAHHGSEDPGLPAQLEQVRPRIAAITVGRGNRYGHPAPATLAALRRVPQVVRTDRDGTVVLRVFGERVAIEGVTGPA